MWLGAEYELNKPRPYIPNILVLNLAYLAEFSSLYICVNYVKFSTNISNMKHNIAKSLIIPRLIV